MSTPKRTPQDNLSDKVWMLGVGIVALALVMGVGYVFAARAQVKDRLAAHQPTP
jgi:hypothetical protein